MVVEQFLPFLLHSILFVCFQLRLLDHHSLIGEDNTDFLKQLLEKSDCVVGKERVRNVDDSFCLVHCVIFLLVCSFNVSVFPFRFSYLLFYLLLHWRFSWFLLFPFFLQHK